MSTLVSDQRRISVGIGQIAVSNDPNEVLVAYGLGSCVGVSFYDPATRSGGLLHVLLPDSEGRASDGKEPARYADWGVAALLGELTRRGASKASLVIKVAGGRPCSGRRTPRNSRSAREMPKLSRSSSSGLACA